MARGGRRRNCPISGWVASKRESVEQFFDLRDSSRRVARANVVCYFFEIMLGAMGKPEDAHSLFSLLDDASSARSLSCSNRPASCSSVYSLNWPVLSWLKSKLNVIAELLVLNSDVPQYPQRVNDQLLF